MVPPCGEWVEELRRSLFKKTHTHTHTGRAGRPFRPRQEGLIIFSVLSYKEALRGPAESLCIINTVLSLRPGLTHTHATLSGSHIHGATWAMHCWRKRRLKCVTIQALGMGLKPGRAYRPNSQFIVHTDSQARSWYGTSQYSWSVCVLLVCTLLLIWD